MSYPFDPDYVVPTSEVLQEWIDVNHLSRTTAAAAISRRNTPERTSAVRIIDAVLNDKPVTPGIAAALQRMTGITEAFWLAFDHNYRKGLAAGKKVT